MSLNSLYYRIKPLIPRRAQIGLRRILVSRKRARYADIWPIDERAGKAPEGWVGWPDGKKFALVLTHDVETAKGQENCRKLMELEEKLGFRSSFGFVPERYPVSAELRKDLERRGFEVAVHGLLHDGLYYKSRETFLGRAARINRYIQEWGAVGFRSPSMQHNLDWIHDLNIEYDSSTFDTDPFEPQPDGVGTIFPFRIRRNEGDKGYLELPYTLCQDHTLFVIMQERSIDIWKKKLDWIAEKGGMALLICHPDYMHFGPGVHFPEEYPASYYEEFLKYVKTKYKGQYWHVLPKNMPHSWVKSDEGKKSQNYREDSRKESKMLYPAPKAKKTIWIDLDNSPHVPFFSPIIKELRKNGYEVLLTARDCSQTCGLADLFHLPYKRIGRHYGKQKFLKVAGTVFRALQLTSAVRKEKPHLAVSHGSRAQMISARILNVPSIVIMDYEHVKGIFNPNWIMMPEVISNDAIKYDKDRIIQYPGIKEDVYVPAFKPDPAIKEELGVGPDDLLVTIRPPATEAHYHNPQSEALFSAVVKLLGAVQNVRMVILPRNDVQKEEIRREWPEWCGNGKIIIPEKVVDGLNLLWHSDLVISGGGTMNREAAALGVPVYSIFRGKIGNVDRYLCKTGRLILLESVKDVENKIAVRKRAIPHALGSVNSNTLKAVVDGIERALEARL